MQCKQEPFLTRQNLRDLERMELTALMFFLSTLHPDQDLNQGSGMDPGFTVRVQLFSVDQDVESQTGQNSISESEQYPI